MKSYTPQQSTNLAEKFICCMMWNGKKHVSRKIFGDMLDILKEQGEKEPLQVFEAAIENVMPEIEVRPKRIGGSVYQVPVQVKQNRRQSLAIRWVLAAARAKKGEPMAKKLAAEITNASAKAGTAFKKREDVERMAVANKAFAHLARY